MYKCCSCKPMLKGFSFATDIQFCKNIYTVIYLFFSFLLTGPILYTIIAWAVTSKPAAIICKLLWFWLFYLSVTIYAFDARVHAHIQARTHPHTHYEYVYGYHPVNLSLLFIDFCILLMSPVFDFNKRSSIVKWDRVSRQRNVLCCVPNTTFCPTEKRKWKSKV